MFRKAPNNLASSIDATSAPSAPVKGHEQWLLSKRHRRHGPLRSQRSARWALSLFRLRQWVTQSSPYLGFLGIALLLLAWYLLTEFFNVPRFNKLPGPVAVWSEFTSPSPTFGISIYTPEYYMHIFWSVWRVLQAFFWATVLGVPLGLFMGWKRTFRDYTFPVLEIVRPIPVLAWVPVAILIFAGIASREAPVIFLAFLATFFATVLNTMLGVESIDEVYFRAARCLGSKPHHIFFRVVLPGALPFIFTGLQIGVGVGWFSLVAAEMISGEYGLGFLIWDSYVLSQFPVIIIAMLTLGVVGYVFSAIIRIIGASLMRWADRSASMTLAAASGAISIRNVSKVYDPSGVNVLAIDNCSVDIAPGEFCVIVGPSGCGKTTLLNAIAGFHDITGGEIWLDGKPICKPGFTAEPGADRIVVFQNGALFPWSTVLDNVAYGPVVQGTASSTEAKKKAQILLAELGLSGIGDRYPNELSSGMRRRVEIARALINDPKVLLLDEPFRAMDALTKGVAQEFLLQAYDRVRKTVFFITHDLEEAIFLADRVLVMTTRPGLIKQTLHVDFGRPRNYKIRSSNQYLALKSQVFEAVREEAIRAFEAGERELA